MPYKWGKMLIPYNLTKFLQFLRGVRGEGKRSRRACLWSAESFAEFLTINPNR